MTTAPIAPPLPAVPPTVPSRINRVLFYYAILLAISLLPFGFLLLVMMYWVPHFKEIFRDFNTSLPLLTQYVLAVSQWLSNDGGFVFALLLVAAISVPAAMLVAWPEERWKRVGSAILVSLMYVVAALMLCLFIQFTLQLPLVKLIQSVSGGPSGGSP